ncbi:MAG: ribbon-helix-helix protein, CopG family [Lautropia sp.]
MRNVTITLDEETAAWIRVEAARRDTSVSRLVGEMLREQRERDTAYATALRRFRAIRPVPLTREGERYPTRDETHDRARLR